MHKQALFCGIRQASLGNQSGMNFLKLPFLNSIILNDLQSVFYSNKTKISAVKIDKKPGRSVLFSAQKLLYLADTLDNLVFRFPRTLTFQCFGEILKFNLGFPLNFYQFFIQITFLAKKLRLALIYPIYKCLNSILFCDFISLMNNQNNYAQVY
jgi:hypothetical protein